MAHLVTTGGQAPILSNLKNPSRFVVENGRCAGESGPDSDGNRVFRDEIAATGKPRPMRAHPLRGELVEIIRNQPGLRRTEVRQIVAANRGKATYHLIVLERLSAIRVVRTHRATRYFPPEADPHESSMLALLLRGRVLELARAVVAYPGISQQRLTKTLPMSRKVFRDYANLLAQHNLLLENRNLRKKEYFPTDELRQTLTLLADAGIGGPGKDGDSH